MNQFLVIPLMLLLSACSTLKVSSGVGEFKNGTSTTRSEVTLSQDYGRLHTVIKGSSASSSPALDDNAQHSLIDANEWWLGGGYHYGRDSYNRYSATLLLNQDSYQLDLQDKHILLGRIGAQAGFSHRNLYMRKRKTTGANIGLFYRLNQSLDCGINWHIRNNTKIFTDDYTQLSCEWRLK